MTYLGNVKGGRTKCLSRNEDGIQIPFIAQWRRGAVGYGRGSSGTASGQSHRGYGWLRLIARAICWWGAIFVDHVDPGTAGGTPTYISNHYMIDSEAGCTMGGGTGRCYGGSIMEPIDAGYIGRAGERTDI